MLGYRIIQREHGGTLGSLLNRPNSTICLTVLFGILLGAFALVGLRTTARSNLTTLKQSIATMSTINVLRGLSTVEALRLKSKSTAPRFIAMPTEGAATVVPVSANLRLYDRGCRANFASIINQRLCDRRKYDDQNR